MRKKRFNIFLEVLLTLFFKMQTNVLRAEKECNCLKSKKLMAKMLKYHIVMTSMRGLSAQKT